MSITIETYLHEGVGGGIVTKLELPNGPRNLMKAVDSLSRIRRRNIEQYGNVGCGLTWVVVDGCQLLDDDLMHLKGDFIADEMKRWRQNSGVLSWKPKTRTERARDVLEELERASRKAA